MSGAVYLLDKAAGITSRKAAGEVARANNFRKYGHCGTLDPDATGLLIVLLGRATRLADYISGGVKRYSFNLVTGIGTDTLDMSGEVISRADSSGITTEQVEEALNSFTGTFSQMVPLYSAVRVNGKRGYALARQGDKPEMPVRTVTVSDWKHGEIKNGILELEATVSAGTYIRALARDIGDILGVPAVADGIRRTLSGVFSIQEASVSHDSSGSLLTMAQALRGYEKIELTPLQSERVSHGMPCDSCYQGIAALLNSKGELVAIGSGNGSAIQPRTVLLQGDEL